MISISLYEPFSRGSVTLTNSSDRPRVYFALLEDERDRARLAWGARLARDLLIDEAVKPTVHETFVLPARDAMRSLSKPGPMSGFYSFSLATLLNLNEDARRYILSKRLGKNRFLDPPHDDETFDEIVMSSATSMAHPGGTCGLGKVVDSSTALKGAENIFVADASIMPKVPRANTNIATVMIGEKAAFEIQRAMQRK
jgi:choline dehydrogenase-like flavoprotein